MPKVKQIIRGGLQPNPIDTRDIKSFDGRLGAGIFNQPRIEDVPKEFILSPLFQYNQGEDDCSANATALSKSIQEGKKIHASSLFGFSKLISGDPEAWGQTHRNILKAVTKFGCLFEDEVPADLKDKDLSWWREPSNWANRAEELFQLAAKNRAETYVAVTGRYDAFDDIKTAMWMAREKKQAVTFGLLWNYDSSNPMIENPIQEDGFGHLVAIVGCTIKNGKEVLIIKNSWGESVGDNGNFYITRSEINKYADMFGIYMLIDLPPEVAKYYAENGAKVSDNWSVLTAKALTRFISELMKKLIGLLQAQLSEQVGEDAPSKWLLPALVWQESDGNLNAVGDKHLKNRSYGPLQIRKPYMDDVYPYRKAEECLNNLPLSIDVFRKYMARYATPKRIGKAVTDEVLSRIHNGGPGGWKRDSTLVYWYQVQKKMKMLETNTAPASITKKLQELKLI